MDRFKTKEDILSHLDSCTHNLFSEEFVAKVNEIFGVNLKCFEYEADGHKNPKGLTLANGEKKAMGLACFNLALMLCQALNVKYESKLGRGFQVRACCDAIRAAGKV